MSLIPESIEYHVYNISPILLMSWIVWIIIIGLSFIAIYKYTPVPKGIQGLVEYVLEFIYSMADSIIGSKEHAQPYYPLFVGIFFYIFAGTFGFRILLYSGSLKFFQSKSPTDRAHP